jgi:hypothetical protein
MSSETAPQDLEPGVIALGTVYFTLILTAIAWLAG